MNSSKVPTVYDIFKMEVNRFKIIEFPHLSIINMLTKMTFHIQHDMFFMEFPFIVSEWPICIELKKSGKHLTFNAA